MKEKVILKANNETEYKPVLCFGTFFILICQSRKGLNSGKKFKGTEADLFNALMHIAFGNDEYSVNPHYLDSYKSCKSNQKVPCQNAEVLRDFNLKYKDSNHYEKLIKNIYDKLLPLLDISEDNRLVKRIIVLINSDVYDDYNEI
ncbi:MAG: hypothetical protein FWG44_00560 [Oscillospiraceae bacterium]|nr:hypothetical protein [Oscillospiraceae bacterium]